MFARHPKLVAIAGVLAALITVGVFSRSHWLSLFQRDRPAAESTSESESGTPTGKILLSDQAITNLGLRAKPVKPDTFWKTIPVPGLVVDRPGRSDRSVVSPVIGAVAKVNCFPGETVRSGDVLFTIRLLSETIHQTQTDLFKAAQDIKLSRAQLQRLEKAGAAIPEVRIIEVNNQITRLEVAVKAYRRELVNRGLNTSQVDGVMEGEFVNEIVISVPARLPSVKPLTGVSENEPTFEVQECKVDLGQQVQVGQTLCMLANHQMLAIVGRAFRDETALLERSVQEAWPVEVDFQEGAGGDWAALNQSFRISHLSNTIEPATRTFSFLLPLENQSKSITEGGKTQMLWRFRPGQKVRLLVRIERLDNTFVLPAEAVARDGVETFVFTQNVNTFERKPVRVVFQNRQHAVVANDGALVPGSFVVQNGAAQLNRMAKTQSSSVPKGYHIHADGSLHKNEDEGK